MIYNDTLKISYDAVGSELTKPPPQSFRPTPTAKDYEAGYINRSFAKKLNENIVIEIEGSASAKDVSPLYTTVTLSWKITGPKDDRRSGRVIEDVGVINYNRGEIARVLAENDIDLAGVLSNPAEFWRGY